MKYGICGGIAVAPIAAEAGFDYVEGSVANLLKPLENDAAFQLVLDELHQSPLPVPVCNAFVPGQLRITGPETDLERLADYAGTAFERARRAQVEVIVFGSGGARAVPEGWDRERAVAQIEAFLTRIAPSAQAQGVTIVIEPLRRAECNILTTVGEAAQMTRAVNHPNVRLLVDGYHWAEDRDSAEDVIANGALLQHTHLATLPNRMAPGLEPYDFVPFFRALHGAGYEGRISIEGKTEHTVACLSNALAVMRDAQRNASTDAP